MSSCIIFQKNQKCYLASDGAVSINIEGKNIRIKDDYKKTFIYKDSLIFCSGKIEVVEDIIKSIKLLENVSIEYIESICKNNFRGKNKLELFLVKYEDEIKSYQLSSYNNFKPIERIIKPSDIELLSLGFNTERNNDVAFEHIGKHNDIRELFIEIYKEISCNEVGGLIDIFEVSSNGIYNIHSEDLNDGYCICKNILKEADLLVADTIVGKLIAGKNLAIGNENNTMTIDENGIQIEGNIFKVKGTDGTNRDFNSYITMLNDRIIAGVQDSKNHTDAQFKILGDRIVAGVQDSKNHTDTQFQILGNEISTKVAKGQDFHTEFSQTASEFNFTIGRDGAVVINKDGIEVTFNNNQGKAKMGKDGFYWQKDTLSKAYHSLTYKGEIFTSPDVQVGNLVTLPEEFRGKDFEVIVSPKNVKREGAYTLYWLNCYYSGRNPSNGTFKVHGNADWRSSTDGSLAGSTGITVTYVVLA